MSKNKATSTPAHFSPSRRRFLSTAATATSVFAGIQFLPSGVLGANAKLNLAFVGAGGRGAQNIKGCISENHYAYADVDQLRCAKSLKASPKSKYYKDWREMLSKEAGNIDAVVVSTPDHNHAIVAMAAMNAGKHVYVEKPLTLTISEARALQNKAEEKGLCTQMGNQGHANEGARRTNEWIQSGAVGEVREVHTCTNRPSWPQDIVRPKEEEIPATLDWDTWIGPAPMGPYSSQIVPFKWRGYIDYGTGALGDMGAHILDHPVWSLGLGVPESISVEIERKTAGSEKVSHPASCKITYEFPTRGDAPPVKLMWYDGSYAIPRPKNMDDKLKTPSSGCIYYGSDFTFIHGSHGGMPQLVNSADKKKFVEPPKTMERSPGHHKEWIAACKAGDPKMAKSNFSYAAPLTELMLLGTIAAQVGNGTKLTWNREKMTTGNAEADKLIKRKYRDGWAQVG